MPKYKQTGPTFGHPHLPVFILQILLFVAVSCSIAYVVFTLLYGKPITLADKVNSTLHPVQPVTAADISAKKTINEGDFTVQAAGIDQQKLNTLFPEIK